MTAITWLKSIHIWRVSHDAVPRRRAFGQALAEEDAALLAAWLSDPRVLEFYEGRDQPHDLDRVQKHFYAEDSGTVRNIVSYGNRPIGYIQYYEIDGEERELYGYAGSQENIFGMTSLSASRTTGTAESVRC